MKKSTVYEYEASQNSDGEYICNAFNEIETLQEEHANDQSYSSQFWRSSEQSMGQANGQSSEQSRAYYRPYDSGMADELFRQSYTSNFLSGKMEYVEKMRRQFDHMRQSMLDQMESYTFVKNIRK